jgi:hypothetical protein
MLYGRAKDYLGLQDGAVKPITAPGPAADFTIDDAPDGGRFTLVAQDGQAVGAGPDGTLAPAPAPSAFGFAKAGGCPEYPEAEINASGPVHKGSAPYAATRGFIDAHMHMMGFEFLGGNVHCGRPWSPYGITVALAGCPPTEAASPVIESFLNGGSPPATDPVGWPSFKQWPEWDALTHEQSYYAWLERAWRGGERIFVNLFVENHALCSLYPSRRNSCNEMDSVRLQAKDLRALQDYIDAQNGGPGKGWFRIVGDPFQARKVINAGKLAVVPGIEVSNLFDCGLHNGVSSCTNADVDQRLDAVYNDLGVRDMELINKFNNGFAGVTGDDGTTGAVVNTGNKYETGQYWDMKTCTGPPEEHDKAQPTLSAGEQAPLLDAFGSLAGGSPLPVYPAPPHCNSMGLTALGDHLVRRMIEKRMIVDPDHLDVISRKALLDIVESEKYSGVVSSHSWSSADAYPRIYRSGGFVAPYAGDSKKFVDQWKALRPERDTRYYWGIGWGADMNGFGHQGAPRKGPNPVKYPFKSWDGKVTFERQKTGDRTFDINTDGVAHYGLYPDWVEDLRMQAGEQIVSDLTRGPEAYLQMWERAVGVAPSDRCRQRNLGLRPTGAGLVLLGTPAEDVLRGAGQPVSRGARAWTWCVAGHKPSGTVTGVFARDGRLGLVASTAEHHRIGHVGSGRPASAVPASARQVAPGLFVRRAGRHSRFVYGTRGGRVSFVAVGANALTGSAKALQATLRAGRIRR